MLSLKLFNAVLKNGDSDPVVDLENGLLVGRGGAYAVPEITKYYNRKRLDGLQLNKTFHKSWAKVMESTDAELAVERLKHYASTYDTGFTGEIYIPDEVLNVPDVKVTLVTVDTLTIEEMIERSLDLLRSGIALKEDTLGDVLSLLDYLDYNLTDLSMIQNKEAMALLSVKYGIYPTNAVDVLRCLVYQATESTLLIKNINTFETISGSDVNIRAAVEAVGYESMAEIFNRFKPLFLAFRKASNHNIKVVNKIAKLSKTHHKPMPVNALNNATHEYITASNDHWLKNATPFALMSALSALHLRMQGQNHFAYHIRNGKAYAKKQDTKNDVFYNALYASNYQYIIDELKSRVDTSKTVFIQDNVLLGLPVSEKSFIGNVPTGTKILGTDLAVGIYWENNGGARDIDLSGVSLTKVGWDSYYFNNNQSLVYSGDITNAPNGAVEYLKVNGEINPVLVKTNIYSGDDDCKYRLIVGEGDEVSRDYMMNPNNLILCEDAQSQGKESIIGILLPEEHGVSYTITNMSSGNARTSGTGEVSELFREAMFQSYRNALSLNKVLEDIGFVFSDDADIDLSLDKLSKDKILNLFSGK